MAIRAPDGANNRSCEEAKTYHSIFDTLLAIFNHHLLSNDLVQQIWDWQSSRWFLLASGLRVAVTHDRGAGSGWQGYHQHHPHDCDPYSFHNYHHIKHQQSFLW